MYVVGKNKAGPWSVSFSLHLSEKLVLGLPDFSWYLLPKPEKMYQINTYVMHQMVVEYHKST
jgi:hypothetical protein